jgi:SAM-dependent methyltransferase
LTKTKSGIIPAKRAIFEMQSDLEAIESNSSIYEEKGFDKRMEAIDFIGFHLIDRIGVLLQKAPQPAQLILLKHHAEKIRAGLEEIDSNLFKKLQTDIRAGKYKGKELKSLINEYFDFNLDDNKHREDPCYDNLDSFINGLFSFQIMPEQTRKLEPEMVYYQKTPARIVFELVEKSDFKKEDVFFDLGSGLGQAAILVSLLAGITVKGVEFEPAFCNYARYCAAELNLSNVTFINADAREADYAEGTVFFMFTPFKGEMLQEILELLRKEALQRRIKIITYGPCTTEVALQSWLHVAEPIADHVYKLSVFNSLMGMTGIYANFSE